MESSGYDLSHPKFEEYTSMLLHQEYWKKDSDEVYAKILFRYMELEQVLKKEKTYYFKEKFSIDKKVRYSKKQSQPRTSLLMIFSFAFYEETKDLTEADKENLLDMARIFNKKRKERNGE